MLLAGFDEGEDHPSSTNALSGFVFLIMLRRSSRASSQDNGLWTRAAAIAAENATL